MRPCNVIPEPAHPRARHSASRALLFAAAIAASASATSGAQQLKRVTGACDRAGTTSFEFGKTGGNFRSDPVRVGSDGSVARATNGKFANVGLIPREAVTGLARLAWSGGFTALPTSPTKPTRNPDMSRDYIEIHSACGSKHVEMTREESAQPFRELLALLVLATHDPASSVK